VQCGIASVECSVSGAFYNELPEAKHLVDLRPFEPTTSIPELFDSFYNNSSDHDIKHLLIKSDDPRGIQIGGQVHAATGHLFHQVDSIVVRVKKEGDESTRPTLDYMPKISKQSIFRLEKFLIREEEIDDEDSPDSQQIPATVSTTSPIDKTSGSDDEAITAEEGRRNIPGFSMEVDGWMPSKHRDVLIFFAGFNCPLKQALENFGQLLAMTKLDSRVYPILYNWPAGQVLTYHSASRASHSERNRHNFCQLLKGLQHEGIRNVHLMSHSMGAQALLGALIDKEDGSRSDSSLCFSLASDCDEENRDNGSFEEVDGNLLNCKTVTLLNPDFPLVPFREHAFHAVRRLSRTITVVADKQDFALLMSQLVNGIGVYYGYEQPHALLPNDANKKHLGYLETVGKCVESLYFPPDVVSRRSINDHDYMLFKNLAPVMLMSDREEPTDKAWMDLDVIDTTGLDTNVADIRHSTYNLNPSLIRDLEDLITSGRRAMDRSLLYREGNVFSYCSAPSFVNM